MAFKVPNVRDIETNEVDFFIQTIRQILAFRSTETIVKDGKGLKHAGVLIPLMLEQKIWKVLFTRRSKHVSHHKGQISFPGGGVDHKDQTYEETALRETTEEIGLEREQIEVLGRIDDTQTVTSGFIIHPFVGYISQSDGFSVDPFEVDGIIKIPLSHFFKVDSHEAQSSVNHEGKTHETTAYRYHENLIRGATAGMMKNFVDIIGDKIGLLQGKK